jgi:hypothetical protein
MVCPYLFASTRALGRPSCTPPSIFAPIGLMHSTTSFTRSHPQVMVLRRRLAPYYGSSEKEAIGTRLIERDHGANARSIASAAETRAPPIHLVVTCDAIVQNATVSKPMEPLRVTIGGEKYLLVVKAIPDARANDRAIKAATETLPRTEGEETRCGIAAEALEEDDGVDSGENLFDEYEKKERAWTMMIPAERPDALCSEEGERRNEHSGTQLDPIYISSDGEDAEDGEGEAL